MDTSFTSATKLYALLGSPVKHSISPVIHNSCFTVQQLPCKYLALNISPDYLAQTIPLLRENFQGFNVTIPHKQAIMAHLDEIQEQALLCGAVNTVKNEGGRLIGYNTDGAGFMKAFDMYGMKVAGKKVLLLGAGGGARAVLYELLQQGCHVTVANRSTERAELLKQHLAGIGTGRITVWPEQPVTGNFNILVNTTPVGMTPHVDAMPIAPEILNQVEVVYDLIYNPYETRLLYEAGQRGCQIINGFPMLFYQALEANRIWTGKPLVHEVEKRFFEELVEYLKGMQK